MKLFKKILIVIVIIIAIPLIAALFIQKEFTVTREITISKPKQDVFNYVRLLKNQDNYNKWVLEDPKVKKEYRGTDGQVGFVESWESDKVGTGEQTIRKITEGERIDYDVHFIKPMEGQANTYLATEAVSPTETKVKWVFNGSMHYPMNVMRPFVDKMLGSDLETSLNNLKKQVEKS